MATPGELVHLISELLGIPEPTITQHDRNLVVAGLRSKGGRGRSAAKVTARDASNLLTAVLGSAQVKDSVNSVQRYSATRPNMRRAGQPYANADDFKGCGIPELEALDSDHSFVDALEAVIASTTSGSFDQALYDHALEINGQKIQPMFPPVRVYVETPSSFADLHLHIDHARVQDTVSRSLRYLLPIPSGAPLDELTKVLDEHKALYEPGPAVDLKQSRSITARTIFSVGRLLRK